MCTNGARLWFAHAWVQVADTKADITDGDLHAIYRDVIRADAIVEYVGHPQPPNPNPQRDPTRPSLAHLVPCGGVLFLAAT